MKIINFLYIFVIMIVVGIGSLISNITHENNDDKIQVALVLNDGFTVKSQNPLAIKKGEKATFDIAINDEYFYRETKGIEYKDGKLVFDNITTSKNIYVKLGHNCSITVADTINGKVELIGENKLLDGSKSSVKITPDEHYKIESIEIDGTVYPPISGEIFEFTVYNDCEVKVNFVGENVTFMPMSNNLGTIKINNQVDEYHYGDLISLECEFPDNITFNGWSLNGYIEDGGILISENSKLEYTITEDTILYGNFKDIATYNIVFNANSGNIAGDINMECSPNIYVNLPVDDGKITRDGYTLIGYNTSADGSKTSYQLGSMIIMPRKNVKLYAQWAKNTDPSYLDYTVSQSGITINGPSTAGKSITELCIPKKIDGINVTNIANNAFDNVDTLKKVIIPIGLLGIGEKAFANCDKLSTVYIPETLTYMASDAFSGSDKFTHLKILSSMERAFDYDYDSTLADKYLKLKYSKGKRIILVGGSNLTFGINSVMLKERFSDYDIVNFSGSYHYGILTMFELVKANVRKGDIVIFCPEYFSTMFGASESNEIANWQYIESNYDILNDINIKNNPVLLSQYIPYLNYKKAILPGKLKNGDSVYIRSGANSYGDLIGYRTNKTSEDIVVPNTNLITSDGMKRYNDLCKTLTKKGVTCLFTFPPTMGNESSKVFEDTLKTNLNSSYITVISTCLDYTFPTRLFYDSEYHLTLEGAKERTKVLIKDLEAFGVE